MADLAVLVPTVNRPGMLQGLLDNIADATTVPHRVYLIVENADRETVEKLWHLKGDHIVVFGNFGSCAKAMNAGYGGSDEPFVFTGNDDLRFEPGWDTWALLALEEDGKHICGTNDGNGRMTCFALARRAFIEEHSGVHDRPNTLYHDGYESQYVDTELADYAKARGVWTEAPDSLTVHEHWEFGLADPSHPNYTKAKQTCAADHARYLERRPQWEATASQGLLAS